MNDILEDSGKLSEASGSNKDVDGAEGEVLGSNDHSISSPNQTGGSERCRANEYKESVTSTKKGTTTAVRHFGNVPCPTFKKKKPHTHTHRQTGHLQAF
jgi:hypothetical protein